MYLKRYLAYTLGHTELAFAEAVNLMRHDSVGVALWIGFKFSDIVTIYGLAKAEAMLVANPSDPHMIVKVVNEMLDNGIKLCYAFQTPGSVMYSPSIEEGAGHFVITVGQTVMQSAWNMRQSIRAFRACNELFPNHAFSTENGGQSTRSVLPCLLYQKKLMDAGKANASVRDEWDIGLVEQVNECLRFVEHVRKGNPKVIIHLQDSDPAVLMCTNETGVDHPIDLVSFDGWCLDCYRKRVSTNVVGPKRIPKRKADSDPK